MRKAARTRIARVSTLAIATSTLTMAPAAPVQAQALTPVVDICSGISLNESALTDLLNAVNQPIVAPLQGTVNGLLGILLPPLNIDVAGIIDTAVAGNPLTVDVLTTDGTIVGPGDCNVTVDGITLDTPAGIGIGGNQINGLGNGPAASAGTLDSIALGNGATTAPTAPGAIAIGTDAEVTAANSVALGTGSLADRANSVSVGATGAERQITNVAAGSAPTDAANVGQVAEAISALADTSVLYSDPGRTSIVLGGVGGTTISNVAPGALTASSSQAVNGSQLFATNTQVAANTDAIADLDTEVTGNTADIAANTADIAALDTRVTGTAADVANLDTRVTENTGDIAANAADIADLDTRVTDNTANIAANTADVADLDTRVTGNTADIAGLDTRVDANTADTADIADLDTRVTDNTADIAGLDTRVDAKHQ